MAMAITPRSVDTRIVQAQTYGLVQVGNRRVEIILIPIGHTPMVVGHSTVRLETNDLRHIRSKRLVNCSDAPRWRAILA